MINRPLKVLLALLLLLGAPSLLWAGSAREVRVGVFPFIPGISMNDKGEAVGFFADMLREVGDRQGWHLVFVPGTWADGLERIQSGKVDLLTSVDKTPDRQLFLKYGEESALTAWSILYANPKVPIHGVFDVRDRRVAVMRNDINGQHFIDLCRSFNIPCHFIEVNSFPEVLALVASGKTDAGVTVSTYGYSQERNFKIVRTPVVFAPFDLYFTTALNRNGDLLKALDAYLRHGKRTPGSNYHKVVNWWLGTDSNPMLPRWVLYTIGLTLAALCLAVIFVQVLRHQVAHATRKIRELNEDLAQELAERKLAEAQRRAMEQQVQQVQKMESLGLLAGGIAHDFNNLLAAMLGHLNVAAAKLAPGSSAGPHLESLEQIIHRAANLTRQMLAYSGKGRFVVRSQDLNRILRETIHLLEVGISKKIALRFNLADNLPAIEADATQIQQVVMNLVTNASDAIGELDGTIRLTTQSAVLDRTYLDSFFQGENLQPGTYVLLEVSDTGCGMASEVRARIFDPFFTTKPTGHGLGLSATLGILKGHGAGIKIYSEPGSGTTFRILFPADLDHPVEPVPEQVPVRGLRPATILLVDDEDIIRESTQEVLEVLGMKVHVAKDGLAAVQFLEQGGADVDLVLMDLTMPHMDGHEAFQHIRKLRPGLPVILCSGYNQQESAQEFSGRGLAGFLQKPYTLKALSAILEAALAKGDQAWSAPCPPPDGDG